MATKLNEMYTYVCNELVNIKKRVDAIMQESVPPSPPQDNVPIIRNKHLRYYNLRAGEARYFKFRARVVGPAYPIQVSNTSAGGQPRTVHLTIKRGSKPTIANFRRTWRMPPSQYDGREKQWIPAKPGAEKLYWKYNTGSQAEFVEIGEPMNEQVYYVMLYNSGIANVRNQRLALRC